MNIYYSNNINQLQFKKMLKQNAEIDLTDQEFKSILESYQNQINYYFFNYNNKEFSESIFYQYLFDNFLTIEFLNNSLITKLLKILKNVPTEYAFEFINLLKKNKCYDSKLFQTTNDFLNNKKLFFIYKSMIINDF